MEGCFFVKEDNIGSPQNVKSGSNFLIILTKRVRYLHLRWKWLYKSGIIETLLFKYLLCFQYWNWEYFSL